jgi:exonuclease SbcC
VRSGGKELQSWMTLTYRYLNFMSHEDTEIDFRKVNVACIQGPNGAGKSAVADGMLYALYGQTSRCKDDNIVKLGSQEMTDIFDFEQSAQIYRIIRKKSILGRGKNIVELHALKDDPNDSWTPLATGDAAREMILGILNRDYNTFISSSFLLQGQGERLINSRPSERYKVVFDIMGCERYAEYRKKTTSMKNKIEGRKTVLLDSISDLQTQASCIIDLENLHETKKASLKAISEALSEKEKLLVNLTSELAVVTAKLKELDEVSEKLKVLEKEKAEFILKKHEIETSVKPVAQNLVEQVNALLMELSKKESGLQEAMTILADHKAKLSNFEGIQKEISSLQSKQSSLNNSIKATEKHVERYKKILDNKKKILTFVEEEKTGNKKLQSMREDYDKLVAEANTLNANLRKMSEIETSIAKLQIAVSSKEKDRGHAIKTVEDKISQAGKKASLIEQTVCKGEGEYARCSFIKDAMKERESLGTLKTELAGLNRPLDIPQIKEIEQLKKQLSSLDPAVIKNRLKQATDDANKFKTDIAALERQIELLSTWTKHVAEINTAEIEMERAEKSVSDARSEISDVEAKIKNLFARLQEMKSISDSILVAEAVIDRLQIAAEVKGIMGKLEEIEKNISESKGNMAETLPEYKKKKTALEGQIKEIESAVGYLRQEEKTSLEAASKLEVEIKSCKQAMDKLKDVEKEIASLGRSYRIMEILEDAYERIPFYILDNVIPIMEEEANKILEEISTTGMRLELRTEKVNKNNKNVRDTLDIIISDIAGERPIELYSGGEKTRQILALAVGLAELSARKAGVKISTLLIDEPAGLDKQGLLDFGKSFIKLVESGVFKKGMLMAHEEILKEIFDQKILVTKEGTTSKVEVLV